MYKEELIHARGFSRMQCAIVMCPASRYTNGHPNPFCIPHQQAFEASPEGINRRPGSQADYRNRMWKEECAKRAHEKWENATEEERAEWKKGGFGR